MANFIGTDSGDTVLITAWDLQASMISLGLGYDAVRVSGLANMTFDAWSWAGFSGVDAFDLSEATAGTLRVRVDGGLLAQSDANAITIVSGMAGIDALSADASLGGTVRIAGTGEVRLDDSLANAVTIANGASVRVVGGAGADTITASSTGSVLDGGAGADRLIAGAGADTIVLKAGYGADRVSGFSVAADKVDLTGSGLTFFADVKAHLSQTASGALLDLGGGTSLIIEGVSTSALGLGNFAGVLADPKVWRVEAGTSAAAVNALIANAGAGDTILFANGTHTFDQSLVVRRGDLTIMGESEAGTILKFALATGDSSIKVIGGAKALIGATDSAIARGDDHFTMSNAGGIKAGDKLYIAQDNTLEYLAANGWSNVSWTDAATKPFREQIVEVDHVEGTTVYLKGYLAYDMDAGLANVSRIGLLNGLHLSDFTVTTNLGTANPNDFANKLPGFDNKSALLVQGTYGATLEHLSVLDSASHAIDIRSSLALEADDLYVRGAHNKGSDGNGYGVSINETFDSTFSNLEIFDMRHGVLFSSWNAEAGNFVHVADTNRDINFHGSPDRDNTVTVDRAVLDYDPSQNTGTTNGWWPLAGTGSTMHAATDIYGWNSVKFDHAVGHNSADTVYGADGGCYLNGKASQDRLFGGNGDDTIVGGLSRDTMAGGAGTDTFIFRVGDNFDTIQDFKFGAGGDRIVLTGTATLDALSDLVISQVGADLTIKYGASSTIILTGCALKDFNAGNLIFDPSGAAFGALY